MALTSVDKMKIAKYLRDHAVEEIYYIDLCDALCKRGKIRDIEFIQYFTECVAKEFRKNEKVSIKQLTKMILLIDNFLNWMHQEDSLIDDDTLDIIRSFEELYDEYLNRTNFDIDLDFTDNVIGKVLETIKELYPSKGEGNESVAKYINQIAMLEDNLKKVTRELEEANRLYAILEENNRKSNEKLTISQQDVISLSREIKTKDVSISELNTTIENLRGKIEELERLLNESREQNKLLSIFQSKYEEVYSEVLKLRKIIEDDIKEQSELAAKRAVDSQMEALIYQQLLFDGANIDAIIRNLKSKGFVSDKDNVYSLLQSIKSKINVTSGSFSFSPKYKIVAPTIGEDGEFRIDIPSGCKHYDIMLVSDFHIKDVDSKVLAGIDTINNYCSSNGINLILNLGDFYHGTAGHLFEYESAISNYKVVEKSISMIPRAEGIYHAVLGGNHDRNTVRYGFDPIGMLCDSREDFINLGYTHSTVSLNGFCNQFGKFDIHHPETFDFPIDLREDAIDFDLLNGYLDRVYAKQGRSRDDSYIDIFGHTHKSQFNYPTGYCYIPSYFEGKSKRGACHLRIYLDEDTGIKYMVFMPLSFNDKLIKTNELIYQKIYTK